ncbi:hypothetical protein ACLBWT_00830 [Paenibacillus sp. D51F]
MNRFNAIVLFVAALSLVMLIVGGIHLDHSVQWGSEQAGLYLANNGGSMDTAQFHIVLVLQNFILQIRWKGILLAGMGGLTFFVSVLLLLVKNIPAFIRIENRA